MVIVVDVLSFSTCVSVAAVRGAGILPYDGTRAGAGEFARSKGADLAGPRGRSRYSLSPASFADVPLGARVVLPGVNGSRLSLLTGGVPTLAGCLRNGRAVADGAQRVGQKIAVIPAGERWKEGGALRAGVEDLIGAGAIIRYLGGRLSPEAECAMGAFECSKGHLAARLRASCSGKEIAGLGFERDIEIAAETDADECVPLLVEGAYTMA
ncbi:MAG: 2-phosphosulfolactate phosphatase [bacterium]